MGAFLLFLLVFLLVIILIAFSLVGNILRGILDFFGIGSRKQSRFSNKNHSGEDARPHQSAEGAKRMRKFKNAAEDTDYEMIEH